MLALNGALSNKLQTLGEKEGNMGRGGNRHTLVGPLFVTLNYVYDIALNQ